jgi:hypothetical protein
MKEWKPFLHSPFYFSPLKKVFLKNFTFSFHIFESRVIYIVEGYEKPAVLIETAPYISELRIRNESMEWRSQKRYRFSTSPFPENGQKSVQTEKQQRNPGL